MFSKILIANRGEIACRIIKTAHRLGIQCVAVYSTADQSAQHVQTADEAYCIGPAPAAQSYLNSAKIIETALQAGAQAIHPGYGFLSEQAEFAESCQRAGLIFIGPSAAAMRAMASKSAAKRIMARANVPSIPGYHGEQQDIKTLQKEADKLTYPILLKAAAGGGGKGMRVVHHADEMAAAVAAAQREALANFGDSELLIEKYFKDPRHVEIQIFADNFGQTVHLFERDCSLQRRHQKIIEEAPAPNLSTPLRQALGQAAVAAARAIDYSGAGTVEFLVKGEQFYFMEMNTRLQVEHPVTEMITDIDLVEWQLLIAAGDKLPLSQAEIKYKGHAFEARLYAEDPDKDFLPASGKIIYLKTPAESLQVRLDSGIAQGDAITPFYDPMLAKLIVWGEDRAAALNHLSAALAQCHIVGVQTNLALLNNIATHSAFAAADIHTGFIEAHRSELIQQNTLSVPVLILAVVHKLLNRQNQSELNSDAEIDSPWRKKDNWRLNLVARQKIEFIFDTKNLRCEIEQLAQHYRITFDAQSYTIKVHLQQQQELHIAIDDEVYSANIYEYEHILYILYNGQYYKLQHCDADTTEFHREIHAQKSGLTAPMPGKIVAISATVGAHVVAGAPLAIIEAMKMEHTLYAPYTGKIEEWFFNVGDLVDEGRPLLAFKEITE